MAVRGNKQKVIYKKLFETPNKDDLGPAGERTKLEGIKNET